MDEPQPFESAEECTENCAALDSEYDWHWARQADGTDACAEDVIVAAECIATLSADPPGIIRRPA